MIAKIFPFLGWFKGYDLFARFKADAIAGLTVALVLIPQSMAYAQLAGLPAYYGLYAAFLPPMLAAMFGSSMQLATGPVAVVSLMTNASLAPLATQGGETYIAYAILLALIVGAFQMALGLLRLGLVVNFLSHPVVGGFTNAAAIIIATSQLSKMFGVYVDTAEYHYETVWRVIQAAMAFTHWPTLIMGAAAFATMYGLKRLNPRLPYVLVAVATATVVAWATDFEHNTKADLSAIFSPRVRELVRQFNAAEHLAAEQAGIRVQLAQQERQAVKRQGEHSVKVLPIQYELAKTNMLCEEAQKKAHQARRQLRAVLLAGVTGADGRMLFYERSRVPPDQAIDGRTWRLLVGNKSLDEASLILTSGGAVVGVVPPGLPSFGLPSLNLDIISQLLPYAAIISLLGFMEAISIAKAMAAKTGQRLDPNQELIGQGIANILGSFGRSYPTSGSFSRSAVNLQAGAVTGLSSVFTSLMVLILLLFFTRLLYNLPQSVLAAVIMLAVVGLINVNGIIHAFKAQWYDGVISVVSFFATLAFAPHLDKGIMLGVGLSLGVYLYKSMRPKVAALAMHPDCSLRDANHFGLRQCKHIAVVRFDGPLFFANASFLENKIAERINRMPQLRHFLIVCNGINDMDASGEETLSLLVDRVRNAGYKISFSGINENMLGVMQRTHLLAKIGEENIFPLTAEAVGAIHGDTHRGSDENDCPLLRVCPLDSYRENP